jgi:hypothetical protein
MRNRAPTDVIMDVLANARVNSPHFDHASIAEQILECFIACRINVTTEEECAAARAAARMPDKPTSRPLATRSRPTNRGDKLLEVLGRERMMTPAKAAYQAYVQHYPDRLIMIRQKAQVLRRSDRKRD